MTSTAASRLLERYWVVVALTLILVVIVGVADLTGSDRVNVTVNEMLIRMTVVVATYLFVGNSGILSYGHIAFMCIGAYAAGWATCEPSWKQLMLTGLPDFLQEAQYPFIVAVGGAGALAAVVALLFGAVVIRMSGIAASIATFAFLAIVNSVYSNWDTVTAATSSLIGIPTVSSPWVFLAFTLFAIVCAFLFQESRYGLMLRASRDDEVAARSSAINIVKVRLIAFVLSAFLVGIGGGLYAHFLGVLTVDVFYMSLTFITLSMLIIGGIASLSGAVLGVLAVTLIVEVLRAVESGIPVGSIELQLPKGSQEIGLGIVMALILIFRPGGLTNGREIRFPFRRSAAAPRQSQPARSPDAAQRNPGPAAP
jgi:branched-chain amino acid transport system permease protein